MFEYYIITGNADRAQYELTEYANKGWTVDSLSTSGSSHTVLVIIMRREKEQPSV